MSRSTVSRYYGQRRHNQIHVIRPTVLLRPALWIDEVLVPSNRRSFNNGTVLTTHLSSNGHFSNLSRFTYRTMLSTSGETIENLAVQSERLSCSQSLERRYKHPAWWCSHRHVKGVRASPALSHKSNHSSAVRLSRNHQLALTGLAAPYARHTAVGGTLYIYSGPNSIPVPFKPGRTRSIGFHIIRYMMGLFIKMGVLSQWTVPSQQLF